MLIFFLICGAFIVYESHALQHNLFYGNCAHDNDTIPIYTQEVIMDNPAAVHIPAKPAKKWYSWFSNISFRRHATIPKPIFTGKTINTTIIFPPVVSSFHTFSHRFI